MDLNALAKTIAAKGAPVLADVLGSTLPFPINMVAKVALNSLGQAFGVPADDPVALNNAIQSDPDAAAKVQAVEDTHRAELEAATEQLKANIENDKDARATQIALAQAGSPIAYGPITISVLIILAFSGSVAFLLMAKINFNDVTGQVVLLLTGTLSAAFTQVVNYWLGSSAGSQRNGEAIRQIAQNIPIKTPVPVPVTKATVIRR